jgi:hypothetical protein
MMAQEESPAAPATPEPTAASEPIVVEVGVEIEAGRRYELKIPETAGDQDCKDIGQVLGELRSRFNLEIIRITDTEKDHTKIVAAVPGPAGSPVNRIPGRRVRSSSDTSI